MPADKDFSIAVGRRGVNYRDHPSQLRFDELSDSLNWRIPQRGALEKRLGFPPVGELADDIMELTTFTPAGGNPEFIAYCADGKAYSSEDGAAWTEIEDGLSPTAMPTFVQYLDKLYWGNGTDDLRVYDGSTVAAVASAPVGPFLTVWRNRLWIAVPDDRAVYWSAAADPEDWTNTDNETVFPDGPILTGLATAPNIGDAADGSDGVLVFHERGFYRIIDDSDNDPLGDPPVISGGAYVLVDDANGCVCQRTIAAARGRLYFLGSDGVYSTDGHGKARVETRKLAPLFHGTLGYGMAHNTIGLGFQGRYFLGFTPTGETTNSRVLECYLDLPADEEGQHPWMPHEIPAGAWTFFPSTGGDVVYFADSSTGDMMFLRRLFSGGFDAEGAAGEADIRAEARTGAYLFEVEQPKILRRLMLFGEGLISLSVTPDLERGAHEAFALDLRSEDDPWNDGLQWDDGLPWNSATGIGSKAAWPDVKARYFGFTLVEVSSRVSSSPSRLGLGSVPVGGAAVNALQTTIVPLDSR